MTKARDLPANLEHDLSRDDSALTLWLEAVAILREAAALYRKHDKPGSLNYANAIRPMAILKERPGDLEQTLALWREASQLYSTIDIEGLDNQRAVIECDRQVETMVALCRIARAAEEYSIDHDRYPDVSTVDELSVMTVARYVDRLPKTDSWGNEIVTPVACAIEAPAS